MLSNDKQLDIALLQSYLENLSTDIIEKMLALYIDQSQVYLNDIMLSVTSQSQEVWRDSCHKMKGAAGSVGLLKVHQQLALLEKSTESWETKKSAIEQVVTLNKQAIALFREWLSEQ